MKMLLQMKGGGGTAGGKNTGRIQGMWEGNRGSHPPLCGPFGNGSDKLVKGNKDSEKEEGRSRLLDWSICGNLGEGPQEETS